MTTEKLRETTSRNWTNGTCSYRCHTQELIIFPVSWSVVSSMNFKLKMIVFVSSREPFFVRFPSDSQIPRRSCVVKVFFLCRQKGSRFFPLKSPSSEHRSLIIIASSGRSKKRVEGAIEKIKSEMNMNKYQLKLSFGLLDGGA